MLCPSKLPPFCCIPAIPPPVLHESWPCSEYYKSSMLSRVHEALFPFCYYCLSSSPAKSQSSSWEKESRWPAVMTPMKQKSFTSLSWGSGTESFFILFSVNCQRFYYPGASPQVARSSSQDRLLDDESSPSSIKGVLTASRPRGTLLSLFCCIIY